MIRFFDSSALAKNYILEAGTAAVQTMLRSTSRPFAAQITFAECLAAFSRKLQLGEIAAAAFQQTNDDFLADWKSQLLIVDVNAVTMAAVPQLVRHLRSADAIQLSCALWLSDACRAAPDQFGGASAVEFVASDEHLLTIASQHGLRVFNPATA